MVIPTKELIGKNAKVTEGVYTDDYMDALNQFATVDEVLGEHIGAIAEGKQDPIVGIVMGTLGKCEHENHLVALVMSAARAGEWRAVVREPYKHTPGLDTVTEKNYGHVVEHEGKKYLLPSPSFLTHCKAELDDLNG